MFHSCLGQTVLSLRSISQHCWGCSCLPSLFLEWSNWICCVISVSTPRVTCMTPQSFCTSNNHYFVFQDQSFTPWIIFFKNKYLIVENYVLMYFFPNIGNAAGHKSDCRWNAVVWFYDFQGIAVEQSLVNWLFACWFASRGVWAHWGSSAQCACGSVTPWHPATCLHCLASCGLVIFLLKTFHLSDKNVCWSVRAIDMSVLSDL